MPREARAWDPDSIHHIDCRAHGGAPIFATDDDRRFLVERAARVFTEMGVSCLAWAVLINHYHVLVRSPGPPGRAILRLNTALARRVRRLNGGRGAVFQGRFFSALCTDEEALLGRLAYVTANPLHHRVVATLGELAESPWSSLGEALGVREPRLLDPAALHRLLDPTGDAARARRALIDLLEVRVRMWHQRGPESEPGDDEPAAATLPIVRRMAEELGAPRTLGAIVGGIPSGDAGWEAGAARRAALRAEGWTPSRLVPVACRIAGADAEAVRAGRRTAHESLARAMVVHVAYEQVGWGLAQVAGAVGVSPSAAMRSGPRGAAALAAAGLGADDVLRRSREGATPT